MDNQNNNSMFSNMIQPSAIPEVKDNSNVVQGNSFGSNTQSNNLNQVNSVGTFGIPQSNNVSNEIPNSGSVGSMVNGNDPVQGNNNSFINSGVVSNSLDSNSNMMQSNTSSNNAPLDFGFPSNNGTVSNMNSDFNLGGGVNSNLNNNIGMEVEQPQLQPVNDSIGLGTGVDNSTSATTIVDNGLNMELVNNLSGNSLINEMANSANAAAEINSNVNSADRVEDVVSVKKYLIHMLLCCIPIVGIIILIMRALDRKDKNISNLARAQLLISAIAVLLSVVLTFVMGSAIAGMFANM